MTLLEGSLVLLWYKASHPAQSRTSTGWCSVPGREEGLGVHTFAVFLCLPAISMGIRCG